MENALCTFSRPTRYNNLQIEQTWIYTSRKSKFMYTMSYSETQDESNHDICRQSYVDDSNEAVFETQNQEDLRKALFYLHDNEEKLLRFTSQQKQLQKYIDCTVEIIRNSETSVANLREQVKADEIQVGFSEEDANTEHGDEDRKR